jgi:hypothetical protein
MNEEALRERMDAVEAPPLRLTPDMLVASGRRSVRRRRRWQAAAAALVVAAVVATPPIVLGRDGGRTPTAGVTGGPCPVRALPVLPGTGPVSVDAIDPSGRYVLGNLRSGGPVLWTDGHPTVLPVAGVKAVQATAVNANGVVVGLAATHENQEWDAVVRYTGGRPSRLTPPPGKWIFNGNVRINTAGDAVVTAYSADGTRGAVILWPPGATKGVKLPLPAGAAAFDLTDDGTIAGDVLSDDGRTVTPYVWSRTGIGRKLTTPAGQNAEVFAARGDWVAGNLRPSGSIALWNLRTGTLTVLGGNNQAIAVNVDGWVVAGGKVYRNGRAVPLKGNGTPFWVADNLSVAGSLKVGTAGSDGPLTWSCGA